ncbi:hypothetical protein EDB89DRAFT_1947970 [Lactarius sanguifluus]|nr:hypothetical protein EDB89DRAFT_1947970 [Lactarius sanguifluus]
MALQRLYVDSLLVCPLTRMGSRAYLFTQTSQRSRLEVILVEQARQSTTQERGAPVEPGDDLWCWSRCGGWPQVVPRVAERADRAGRAGRCRPEDPGGRPRVTVVAICELGLFLVVPIICRQQEAQGRLLHAVRAPFLTPNPKNRMFAPRGPAISSGCPFVSLLMNDLHLVCPTGT